MPSGGDFDMQKPIQNKRALKLYWFLHIKVASGGSEGDLDMQKPIQNKRALKFYWFLHIKVALGRSWGRPGGVLGASWPV